MELGGRVVEASLFPARQGRRAFAYLVCNRRRPVPRDALAEAIWGEDVPPTWETSLNALVSKLRRLFGTLTGAGEASYIAGHIGYYQMRFPTDAWVDVEAVFSALDVAEGALRGGDFLRCMTSATVAAVIARRPFLPGEEGEWIDLQRLRLQEALVRGLECLAEACLGVGDPTQATRYAAEAVHMEPLRESAYRCLMRCHASAGNRAQALKVYERCRHTLGEELGVDPAPETEAVYLEILRA